MESVFVKNMPEATVNRTNQKNQKKQNPEGNVSARISSKFPQVFFCFLLNCAKSFLVELWADKRKQKVDLGGGEHIEIQKNTFSSRPKLHEDHAHAPFYLFLWMGMSPRSVELHSPNWFRHDLLNFTSSIKHRDQNRTTRFYPNLLLGGWWERKSWMRGDNETCAKMARHATVQFFHCCVFYKIPYCFAIWSFRLDPSCMKITLTLLFSFFFGWG